LVLETKSAGRGRVRERGRGRRDGSWRASTISESRIGTMNPRRTGARTALSASASDLIRADIAVRAPTAGSREAFARGWSGGSGSQPLQGVAVWFNSFRLRHIFGEDLPTGAHLPEF